MKKDPNCSGKSILQNLSVMKEDKDKVDYIENRLSVCGISESPSKKKRKLSGYNCFVKTSVKKGQDFKSVIKSKAWSTLSDKQKSTWNNHANNGCPSYLWERD